MSPILQKRYGINTDRPIIALAPMSGVTDLPFRTLCEQLGADYSITEMAATAPQLLNSDKNQSRLHFTLNAHLNILQIIGNDARQMAYAAAFYANLGSDIIDINLGCPAKKVNSKGAGSALLSDIDLIKKILSKISKACPVPVTIKTRLGPSHDNYTLYEVANIADSLGIDLITVHGRTRVCKFNGQAQFDEIATVKQSFPQLAIIANGDIDNITVAKNILAHTKCDGLMIGRAAIGNPWLFSEIRQQLDAQFIPYTGDKNLFIIEHIRQMHRFYGENKGLRFARKHIKAYLNYHQKNEQFNQLAGLSDANIQLASLTDLLKKSPINTTDA
ncbi:MAG: tRNA dihydrouridine synthase DusB [Ostreibacterium sp.]